MLKPVLPNNIPLFAQGNHLTKYCSKNQQFIPQFIKMAVPLVTMTYIAISANKALKILMANGFNAPLKMSKLPY
jgi:hypothetical protein